MRCFMLGRRRNARSQRRTAYGLMTDTAPAWYNAGAGNTCVLVEVA